MNCDLLSAILTVIQTVGLCASAWVGSTASSRGFTLYLKWGFTHQPLYLGLFSPQINFRLKSIVPGYPVVFSLVIPMICRYDTLANARLRHALSQRTKLFA